MDQRKQIYNKIAVGERIRDQRKRLGLSRRTMAEQIGKAEKYYADIERGYCGMSLETMIEIAGCLGLRLDYMIFGDEEGNALPEESRSIMVFLENCDKRKRKKAVELLHLYLSE